MLKETMCAAQNKKRGVVMLAGTPPCREPPALWYHSDHQQESTALCAKRAEIRPAATPRINKPRLWKLKSAIAHLIAHLIDKSSFGKNCSAKFLSTFFTWEIGIGKSPPGAWAFVTLSAQFFPRGNKSEFLKLWYIGSLRFTRVAQVAYFAHLFQDLIITRGVNLIKK